MGHHPRKSAFPAGHAVQKGLAGGHTAEMLSLGAALTPLQGSDQGERATNLLFTGKKN